MESGYILRRGVGESRNKNFAENLCFGQLSRMAGGATCQDGKDQGKGKEIDNLELHTGFCPISIQVNKLI